MVPNKGAGLQLLPLGHGGPALGAHAEQPPGQFVCPKHTWKRRLAALQ